MELSRKVINLVKPFEEATEDISSESSSMALFIPVVNLLSKLLQVDEEDYGIMAIKKCFFLCKLDLGVAKLKIFLL